MVEVGFVPWVVGLEEELDVILIGFWVEMELSEKMVLAEFFIGYFGDEEVEYLDLVF